MAGCRLRVLDCVAYVGSFVICFINSVGLTLCISVLFDLCWCDCGFVGCEFLFGFDLWLAVCFGVIWCFCLVAGLGGFVFMLGGGLLLGFDSCGVACGVLCWIYCYLFCVGFLVFWFVYGLWIVFWWFCGLVVLILVCGSLLVLMVCWFGASCGFAGCYNMLLLGFVVGGILLAVAFAGGFMGFLPVSGLWGFTSGIWC